MTMWRADRVVAVVMAAFAAVLIGGLAGCGSAGSAPDVAAASASTQVKQVGPAEFETLIGPGNNTLINVHVPREGEIAGTTHHIAYDQIVGDSRLPEHKAAVILLYCRSGNMSAEAGQALLDAGYTNVVELRGGFNAWKASGRPLDT